MLIFFDFDGTLVDISERWWQLHLDTAKQFQLPPYQDRSLYISLKRSGCSEIDIMNKAADNREHIEEYDRERIKRIELPEYLRYDRLFNDSMTVLESLQQQGHRLALVSKRRNKENFLREFKGFGLLKYIRDINVSGRFSKKEMLQSKYSAATMENSLFVSDDIDDMKTADALHMRSVTAGFGCRSPWFLKTHGAKTIIKSLTDLLINV